MFMKKALFCAGAIMLLASSGALAFDIQAGPLRDNGEASMKCPGICSGLRWNGQWKTTQGGVMSVCGTTAGVDVPVGPIANNGDAKYKCPAGLARTTFSGQWRTTRPGVASVCGCNPPPLS
jgi:hypothetical protein